MLLGRRLARQQEVDQRRPAARAAHQEAGLQLGKRLVEQQEVYNGLPDYTIGCNSHSPGGRVQLGEGLVDEQQMVLIQLAVRITS